MNNRRDPFVEYCFGFEKYIDGKLTTNPSARIPLWEMKKARMFVVTNKELAALDIMKVDHSNIITDMSSYIATINEPIDMPFSCVLVEATGGGFYITPIDQYPGLEVACFSFMCREYGPGNYAIEAFGVNSKERTLVRFSNIDIESEALIKDVLRKIFNRTKLIYGEERLNKTIRIKNRAGKEWWKVPPITHISLTKENEKRESIMGGPIEWKHSWEVRGHWRRVSSIGRDREGKYCIPGFTWIEDYVKGDGKLIKKIRIINEPRKQD